MHPSSSFKYFVTTNNFQRTVEELKVALFLQTQKRNRLKEKGHENQWHACIIRLGVDSQTSQFERQDISNTPCWVAVFVHIVYDVTVSVVSLLASYLIQQIILLQLYFK
eukprot:m.52268 g.52268  ORF g.52268 m.52268 type:complete len:109 (+) comp7615_c1_seq2:1342-1668(+)